MQPWDLYPKTYRAGEVTAILRAVRSGDCVAVAGLSGSGKSNLCGFLANRCSDEALHFAWVDCNRAEQATPEAIFDLTQRVVSGRSGDLSGLAGLEEAIQAQFAGRRNRLCLLFDRFDRLPDAAAQNIANNLRALRDANKYSLTLVVAMRREPEVRSELAELFYGHTIWLGPLSKDDAFWSAARFAERYALDWEQDLIERMIAISGGYPAWLRAICEAVASGVACELPRLMQYPAVQRRLQEFWADAPTQEMIERSRLANVPLIAEHRLPEITSPRETLTVKEQLLLDYLQSHAGKVCEKDDLIRAIWPEDRLFARGVRDDSLAQLVRRLREKIEENASKPQRLVTVPGRGYRFLLR